MQVFPRMSNIRSSKMLPRPSWVAPYSWNMIKIVLYGLDCDLFKTCRTSTLDSLFIKIVVVSFGNGGLSVPARRSCINVRFSRCRDNSIDHFDDLQCMHAALLEPWRLYRGSSARVRSQALELHSVLAWGLCVALTWYSQETLLKAKLAEPS